MSVAELSLLAALCTQGVDRPYRNAESFSLRFISTQENSEYTHSLLPNDDPVIYRKNGSGLQLVQRQSANFRQNQSDHRVATIASSLLKERGSETARRVRIGRTLLSGKGE